MQFRLTRRKLRLSNSIIEAPVARSKQFLKTMPSPTQLQRLALIVRAADVKGQESAAPEGVGLHSIAQGFAALGISDEERFVRQFPIYDALYAYVQGKG